METVDMESKVAELTATIAQQSETVARLLGQIEELKKQHPQNPPRLPLSPGVIPPVLLPPLSVPRNDDEWFEKLANLGIHYLDQETLDKLNGTGELEGMARKSKRVDNYMDSLSHAANERLPKRFKSPIYPSGRPLLGTNSLALQPLSNQSRGSFLRQDQCKNTTSTRNDQPRPNRGLLKEQKIPLNLGIPLSLVLERMIESGHLKRMDPRPIPNPLSPGYNMNQYCAYHQIPGHDTDHCMSLRHEVRVLIEKGVIPSPYPVMRPKIKALSLSSNQSNRCKRHKEGNQRHFTPLSMNLSTALNHLIRKGHLTPLEPSKPPNRPPPGYNESKYCDYHQDRGHETNSCKRLRHAIQDLLDGIPHLDPVHYLGLCQPLK